MLFNSLDFLVYFIIVNLVCFGLASRYRPAFLLCASCYFYMAFIPAYILILVATIVVDYFAGIWIAVSVGRARKLALALSLCANIGILAVFKYYDFLVQNFKLAFASSPVSLAVPDHLGLILPLGLSFHTFQAMSYTIEVFRGAVEPERNFVQYALYVMFYPQLVAGPIERPQNILHQLRNLGDYEPNRLVRGLKQIVWGLFKKCVIADRLAIMADYVYNQPTAVTDASYLLATVFFAIQIYCDFSGYSEMALGTAEILGVRLMTNFRRPYFAASVSEFWKRWHISLSTWFRDYLYIPLGGSRRGQWIGYRNLLITFLVSGLWHGAAWTYVVWGALNGALLVLESLVNRLLPLARLPQFIRRRLGQLYTLSVIMLTWVFFRARSMSDGLYILKHILRSPTEHLKASYVGGMGGLQFDWVVAAFSVGLLFAVEALEEAQQRSIIDIVETLGAKARLLVYYGFCLAVVLLGVMDSDRQFIYFQF